ncbi:MAG: diaminopimelate epimerase [Candidatus Auribacterota bacterium]|nr:diaminopimelate epimerase [Candidatus Auribacterota bacterium]
MTLEFTKMHGLGNDFIVIDTARNRIGDEKLFSSTYCDRRFGIGADQLLLLDPSDIADFKMRIFNADGSEVEMCGNGIRCIAKYIADKGLSKKKKLAIETLAGIIYPEISNGQIRVNMGKPRLAPADIPARFDGDKVLDAPLTLGGTTYSVTAVSMGNPHCILFVDDLDNCSITTTGPLIEHCEMFPKRTNVEFVRVLNTSHLNVRVWERGSGITLACGTGACAAAVAACLHNRSGRAVTVTLPGGDLFIEWTDTGDVFMTGPAQTVFHGHIAQ